MNDGHFRHLLALATRLEETLQQIEKVAVEGRSPADPCCRLTPLPQACWLSLRESLERARTIFSRHAAQLLPGIEAHLGRVESLETSFYWLRLLLNTLQDEVQRELEPVRFEQQYGALPPAEQDALQHLHRALHRSLVQMHQVVTSCKESRGNG